MSRYGRKHRICVAWRYCKGFESCRKKTDSAGLTFGLFQSPAMPKSGLFWNWLPKIKWFWPLNNFWMAKKIFLIKLVIFSNCEFIRENSVFILYSLFCFFMFWRFGIFYADYHQIWPVIFLAWQPWALSLSFDKN
jgi:hypothetical protein